MRDFQRVDRDYLFSRASQKWGRWDRDVISLSVADIDYPPPKEVQEAVQEWLTEERAPYAHYQGEVEVRQALAEKVVSTNGIPVTAEDILVTPGTMFAIFLVCYLCLKPGDEAILTPAPVYGPFWKNVRGAGATPVPHNLGQEAGFPFQRDSLEELVTERTRLLMVCNPHNPTGRVLAKEDLETIARVACDRDLTIFSDELYEDMIFEGAHHSMAALSEEAFRRCLTVFGFSKAFGIPGYRVAYMVIPPEWRERVVETTKRMIVHTDTLAQAAAIGAVKAAEWWLPAFMAHLGEMRARSVERIRGIPGIACSRPQATPFLFPDMRAYGISSEALVRHLLERGRVVVQSGTEFGPAGEGYVRLNLATSWDVLGEAFDRMATALGEL